MSESMDIQQRTIRRQVEAEGVGLHSGQSVRLTLSPAVAETGVLFRAPDGTLIPATIDNVVDGHFATTIGAFGVKVRTIEHLMAATAAMGIDNLVVDVSANELPAMDGSSRPFVDLLASAGRVLLPATQRPIVIEEPVRVEDGTRWIQVLPAESYRISYTLDHDHPAIGLQVASYVVTEEVFAEQIAPARTYGFLRDMGAMRGFYENVLGFSLQRELSPDWIEYRVGGNTLALARPKRFAGDAPTPKGSASLQLAFKVSVAEVDQRRLAEALLAGAAVIGDSGQIRPLRPSVAGRQQVGSITEVLSLVVVEPRRPRRVTGEFAIVGGKQGAIAQLYQRSGDEWSRDFLSGVAVKRGELLDAHGRFTPARRRGGGELLGSCEPQDAG